MKLHELQHQPPTNRDFLYDYHIEQKIWDLIPVEDFWKQNVTGKNIKIAIFDTGISEAYALSNSENLIEL